MALFDWLTGTKDKLKRLPTQSPLQEQYYNQLLTQGIGQNPLYQQGSSYLQNLLSGSPEAYESFERPLMEKFQQEIAPGIAEQFAGYGTGASGLSSSGLYNSLAQAGRGLASDIGSLRGQLQLSALPQALGYAQQPYTNTQNALQIPSFAYHNQRGQQGLFSGLLSGAGAGIGMAAGGPLAGYFGHYFGGL